MLLCNSICCFLNYYSAVGFLHFALLVAVLSIVYDRLLTFYLIPQDNIDDCANHPCKNNGTCTDRVNAFNCSCAPGFNGTQCETGNYSQNIFILYHVLWGFNIFLSCLQCRKFKYSFDIVVVSFVLAGFIEYARLLTFYHSSLKQISMIVQVIPVRTTGPVQTE